MSETRAPRRERRANALVVVVIAVILAVVAATTLLAISRDRSVEATDVQDRLAATLLAEAGVSLYLDAINTGEIAEDILAAGTPPPRSFAGQTGTANVQCNATGYPWVLVVTSAGTVGTRTIVVEASAVRGRRAAGGGYGVGSRGDIDLAQANLVDSYDSSAGPYATSQGSNALVGNSSGAITIGPSVVIEGAVTSGGTVTADGSSTVSGGIVTDNPATFDLVDQQVDDAIAAAQAGNTNSRLEQAIAASGGGWELTQKGVLQSLGRTPPPLLLPAGSYSLSGIELGQGSRIVLSAGATKIALDGDLTLDQGATLQVHEDMQVELFAKGSVTLHQTFGPGLDPATTSMTPSQFQVYGHSQGGPLTVHRDSTLFGLLNWPGQPVQLDQNCEVFGSVIGSSIQADLGVKVHFDSGAGAETPDGPFRATGFRNASLLR